CRARCEARSAPAGLLPWYKGNTILFLDFLATDELSYGLGVALETGTGMGEKPVRRRTHCTAVNRGASRRAVLRIAIAVLLRGTSRDAPSVISLCFESTSRRCCASYSRKASACSRLCRASASASVCAPIMASDEPSPSSETHDAASPTSTTLPWAQLAISTRLTESKYRSSVARISSRSAATSQPSA